MNDARMTYEKQQLLKRISQQRNQFAEVQQSILDHIPVIKRLIHLKAWLTSRQVKISAVALGATTLVILLGRQRIWRFSKGAFFLLGMMPFSKRVEQMKKVVNIAKMIIG